MKKVLFFMLMLVFLVSACSKEESVDMLTEQTNQVSSKTLTKSSKTMMYGMEIKSGPHFNDHSMHGIPKKTVYKFWIGNPSSAGIQKAFVVFTIPSGGDVTKQMKFNSSGNLFLEQTLSEGGRYSVRYVYYTDKECKTVTPGDGYVYNTNVHCSDTPIDLSVNGKTEKHILYHLVWPFGADGSSYSYRAADNGQRWAGGQEGGPGAGWGELAHKGRTERFSDDWNRGSGNQDLGAEMRSPLDGYVERIGKSHIILDGVDYGWSKYVSIIQYAPNGIIYRFYVGHLAT